MAGWGSYQPRKKSPADARVEARREFGKQYPGCWTS
jgi:hypothetical protein